MDSLSKTIRKNIVEIQQSKKNKIVEYTIVKNRFDNLIKESKNRKSLFFGIIYESRKLIKSGIDKNIINENLLDLLQIFFKDQKGMDIISSFKIESSELLIEKIGLEQNSVISNAITKTFSEKNEEETNKLFTDSDFLAEKIVSHMIDEFGLENQSDKNNMTKVLTTEIKSLIRPHMESIRTKMDDKFEDLKNKSLED